MSVKYKHNIIVIDINSVEDSHFFQKLLYPYGFNWGVMEDGKFFDDSCCYYYLELNKLHLTLSGSPGNKYLDKDRSMHSNGKIYSIHNYERVLNIIKYGSDIPSYKPKNIIRVL
jgi:hypothetical protein